VAAIKARWSGGGAMVAGEEARQCGECADAH
jgi:hypothetical protein